MGNSGIDTKIFKPHSTRVPSNSAAYTLGMLLQEVLKRGQRSNADTFFSYYFREIEDSFDLGEQQDTWWVICSNFLYIFILVVFFFLSGFSFTDTDDSQESREREWTIFYSTLPLPPAHKLLQLCMWIFLITSLVFTRLLLDEIYHLIKLLFWLIDDVTLVFVCLHDNLILAFLLQQFETGNWWIRTHINYHPCITSEPTNQVC